MYINNLFKSTIYIILRFALWWYKWNKEILPVSYLVFRDSFGHLDTQLNIALCYSSGCGVKLRTHVKGKVLNSMHLLLNKSISTVYDDSSELKSTFRTVFQGRGSSKRSIQEEIVPLEHVFYKVNFRIWCFPQISAVFFLLHFLVECSHC